jgi:uncharacterized protein (DUF433 family)
MFAVEQVRNGVIIKDMETSLSSSLDSNSPAPPSLADMIVKTPDTCFGRARIAGTRIKVEHIYNWVERAGMTPVEVVEQYPHLTKAQVYAALAYYWSHEEEIQNDIAEGEKFVAELKAKMGPSKLQEKLAQIYGKDDPLSP